MIHVGRAMPFLPPMPGNGKLTIYKNADGVLLDKNHTISHLLLMVNLLRTVLNVGPGHKPIAWRWLCPTSGRLIVIPVIAFFHIPSLEIHPIFIVISNVLQCFTILHFNDPGKKTQYLGNRISERDYYMEKLKWELQTIAFPMCNRKTLDPCEKKQSFGFLDFRSYTFDAFQMYLDPPVPPKNVFWHLYFFLVYLDVFAGSRYLEYVYVYIIFIFIFKYCYIINYIYTIYIYMFVSVSPIFSKNRMMGSSPIDTPWT